MVLFRNTNAKLTEAGICQGMFYAASAFKMPAMSPTMTEGNIAAWKVKEGI